MTTYQSPSSALIAVPTNDLLHATFEAQVNSHPDRIALVCNEQQMNYQELERSANQLAHYLRALGIGCGSRVGLLMERSINVYIAVLGILKVGAAYVPMDPDYPADRVHYILADSGVDLLVTNSTLVAKHSVDCPVLCLDREIGLIEQQDDQRLTDAAVTGQNLCYIIYTSGSTGRPKGVMLEHRSVANFISAASEVYGVQATDRVYQGFSIAFDASIEEIWLTFAAGATLVVGTAEMVHAGSDLAGILTDLGVTVFSCVPTLLSMLQEDMPLVRLLILGGEACQPELIQRWHRPERRILNTYGPTEASVVTTYAECHSDRPITIGRPLPTYEVQILDEDLQPVAVGVSGQIFIGGDCLARGYVNREELTLEKFIIHPKTQTRLYQSGDLGCWTSDGEIRFLGRADDQVKLRGFRVELSEIESVLMECVAVQIAVVALKEQVPGIQTLVAYLVLQEESIDLAAVRAHIGSRLPSFMVPTCFHRLTETELPRLASGKVNRHQLPPPVAMPEAAVLRADFQAPSTPLEQKIAPVWERLLNTSISIDDNFFDLGGHSLLAAAMVSELRRDPELQQIAVADVYHYPTVKDLAHYLADQQVLAPTAVGLPHPRVGWQYWTTALGQIMGIYGVQALVSLNILIPTFAHHLSGSWLDFVAALIAMYPILLAVSIVAKWLLIGRYRAGSYPLWGTYYLRWWLARQLQGIVPIWPLIGTPFLAGYYRLMGAKIGRNCYLGSDELGSFDLIRIGNDTSVGSEAHLLGYTVSDGYLHLGNIDIGQRCFVGARTVLEPNSQMADDSQLEDLSLLPTGVLLPAGECWYGSPACPIPAETVTAVSFNRPATLLTTLVLGSCQLMGIVILNLLPLLSLAPGLLLSMYLGDLWGWRGLLLAPFSGIVAVGILTLEILLLKKLVLPKITPGVYSLHGSFYLRKWWVDRLMQMSLEWLGALYGTLYSAPWLRLLGAKIGTHSEVSTATNITPELLTIGQDCFVADDVCLGAPRVQRGWLTLQPVQIGNGSFLGNSALIPANTCIGNDTLIGCLSVPPYQQDVANGTAWAGSPAFCLPQRQQDEHYDAGLTFKPSRQLLRQRLTMEFWRIVMPLSCTVTLLSILLYILGESDDLSFLQLIGIMPLWSLGMGLVASFLVVIAKWLIVGRYKSQSLPLWNPYVWRSELVTGMYETIALPWLVDALLGTPFIAWYWRCLGVKVGQRVYIDSPYITEFDLVHIGDRAALNYNAGLQTHLFEDRVMKMSHVHVGKRCVVGDTAIVLYDTQMEAGAQLGSLSLLMKGETLPANTRWQGIPAQISHR